MLHPLCPHQNLLDTYSAALLQRLPKTVHGQTSVSPPFVGQDWCIRLPEDEELVGWGDVGNVTPMGSCWVGGKGIFTLIGHSVTYLAGATRLISVSKFVSQLPTFSPPPRSCAASS